MLSRFFFVLLVFEAGELGETHRDDEGAVQLFVSLEFHYKILNIGSE